MSCYHYTVETLHPGTASPHWQCWLSLRERAEKARCIAVSATGCKSDWAMATRVETAVFFFPRCGQPCFFLRGAAKDLFRLDTQDPCGGFIGDVKNLRRTTVPALRHAGSLWKVHRRRKEFAPHHSASASTRRIPVEGSSAT